MSYNFKIKVEPVTKLTFEGGNTVMLLGFKLVLSDSEYDLLSLIVRRSPDHTTARDLDSVNISPSSLPVTVSSINKKAARISARRLIISERGKGYRINPHM